MSAHRRVAIVICGGCRHNRAPQSDPARDAMRFRTGLSTPQRAPCALLPALRGRAPPSRASSSCTATPTTRARSLWIQADAPGAGARHVAQRARRARARTGARRAARRRRRRRRAADRTSRPARARPTRSTATASTARARCARSRTGRRPPTRPTSRSRSARCFFLAAAEPAVEREHATAAATRSSTRSPRRRRT